MVNEQVTGSNAKSTLREGEGEGEGECNAGGDTTKYQIE